jgi:hypothetical protein
MADPASVVTTGVANNLMRLVMDAAKAARLGQGTRPTGLPF